MEKIALLRFFLPSICICVSVAVDCDMCADKRAPAAYSPVCLKCAADRRTGVACARKAERAINGSLYMFVVARDPDGG